jgi:hypothetical protein
MFSALISGQVVLPNAPASRCHSPPSLEADTVRPALVDPVKTTHFIKSDTQYHHLLEKAAS